MWSWKTSRHIKQDYHTWKLPQWKIVTKFHSFISVSHNIWFRFRQIALKVRAIHVSAKIIYEKSTHSAGTFCRLFEVQYMYLTFIHFCKWPRNQYVTSKAKPRENA